MRSINVLVVGGNNTARALGETLNGDYTLSFAESGSTDIEKKVLELNPDLVIMDINTLDDLKSLRTLKESRETENIPVMAAVDKDDVSRQEQAIKLGAEDYLGKPFNPTVVGNRVFQFTEKTELLKMAFVDGLTQINNRRSFDMDIVKAWEHCARKHRPLAVVLFDIDCFKMYNDTYGHYQGDRALRRVAREAAAAVRKNDFVARYGGEEFVAVLRRTTLEDALGVAERIRTFIERADLAHEATTVKFANGAKPRVTVSVGVAACFPSKNLDMQGLMNLADQSLYKAKAQGRNQVCGEMYGQEKTRAALADAKIMGRNSSMDGKPLGK